MPKTLLSAAQAWEAVTFFSIDTNLIQQAGYNFKQGALHLLPKQLPESIGLRLPDIVVSEVVKHRMVPVREAHAQLGRAIKDLERLANLDTASAQGAIDSINIIKAANQQFTEEVHDYARRCRGSVLATEGQGAPASLFADYFANRPPFGLSEKKKSEFPDAMCLWQLEQFAKDHNTLGIIASDDKGWKQYAEGSERLYCVGSIDELAALFSATTKHAEAIKEKISTSIADTNSPLRIAIIRELASHVSNSEWDVSEIFTGSSYRVEPEFYDANISAHEINGAIDVWSVKGEPTTWLVELTFQVKVDVQVAVEFYAWDSIDREEISLGSHDFSGEDEISVEVYLTCSDVHLDSPPSAWHTDIEIADGDYILDGFQVDLDYGPDD